MQKVSFQFYGQDFQAFYGDDLRFYVPLRAMCDYLGIDPDAQRQRIQRDEAISDALVLLETVGTYEGRERAMKVLCLRLDRLPYWAGTIDTKRIKPEVRDSVVAFKREFVDVAWAAFRSSILPPEILAEVDMHLPPQVRGYYQAMDQAAELRNEVRGKMQEFEASLDALRDRLSSVEERFSAVLSPSQQLAVRDMVEQVANALVASGQKRDTRAAYPYVYGELQHAFDVARYQDIPCTRFEDVKLFLLNKWKGCMPGKTPPTAFSRDEGQRSLL